MAKTKKAVKAEPAQKKKERVANPNTQIPSKFTAVSIIDYVAVKNGFTRKEAKQLTDDLYAVISAGVLKGARVPVGPFGKMIMKIRKAAPERKGRNPLTGAEIMIKARPETKVPKFSFSKSYKQLIKSQ